MRDNPTLHLDTNKGNGTSILFLFYISVWRCVQLDWNLSEVDEKLWFGLVWFMVFNATFDNISIIICVLWGRNRSTRRRPPTYCKSLGERLIKNLYNSMYSYKHFWGNLRRFRFVVFNATFNNISAILWQEILGVCKY